MAAAPHLIYRIVGARIAAVRRARGWSQERLAEAAGIETSYVARIEAGTRRATLDKVVALADALGIPIARLFAPEGASPVVEHLPAALAAALTRLSYPDLELLASIAQSIREQPGRYVATRASRRKRK